MVFEIVISAIVSLIKPIFSFLFNKMHTNKRKVQLILNDDIPLDSKKDNKECNCVHVKVVNNGLDTVKIELWGFELDECTGVIIMPLGVPSSQSMSIRLPCTLKEDEDVDLYYEIEFFKNILSKFLDERRHKKSKKIKFFVIDSVYRRYSVLTNKTVAEFLNDTAIQNVNM